MRPVPAAILAAVRGDRLALARMAGWSAAEALPALLSGLTVARAVDRGFLAGRPLVGLGWLALLALALPVGAAGTRRCYQALGALVEPFRDHLLRRVVAGALARATGGAADGTAAVARLTHQVEIVRDSFAGLVMVVRGFLFTVAGALLGLAALAPRAVPLVLPPVLAGVALFVGTLRATVARQREYVLAEEALAATAGAALTGLRDVAACGAQVRVAALVGEPIDAQARAERALARMAAVRTVSLAAGGWLPLILVLAAAPTLATHGLTTGAILGTLVYVLHGLHPAMHTVVHGVAGGLRLAVTLDRLLRTADAPARPPARALPPARSPLVLQGVSFRYGRHADPVVKALRLAIRDGDHLAVVGPSGVGKSTLAALLAGTLTAQSGVVRLGNVDVSRLDPAALARHRVLIPQEAYVFTGTVRENLSYLDPEAAVEAAVAALGLESFVTRLGGYEAIVSPGRLSAGERQLVALARAYLSPARLAILDEATCHLDPATEARVESAFAARPGALVVVAHRVSSALRARRILLLDGSEAVVGDHQRLLERSALYRDLVGHWHHTHPGPATRLAAGSAGGSAGSAGGSAGSAGGSAGTAGTAGTAGSAGRHRRPAPRPTPRPVP